MRVWIDLSNSPHPLLFEPVARALEAGGSTVLVTARDNAQTIELARERWPGVTVIGEESPPGRAAKAGAMLGRVRSLAGWARRNRPDVALSHNSYGQIVAARAVRVPAVTAMDFEHQPANHLAFRAAQTILVPEALPAEALRRQGASERKLIRFRGLKEELYLGEFEPDPGVVERLGVERPDGAALVVARTPPARAAYHRFGNPLFEECLEALGNQERVRLVVLPRHAEQRDALEAMGLPNLTVPASAVDSRSLMREADLVLGAGGTMTREAALLGVPTLSAFAGARPAVDDWLIERGMLARLEGTDQVADVRPREGEPVPVETLRERARDILACFRDATMKAGTRR